MGIKKTQNNILMNNVLMGIINKKQNDIENDILSKETRDGEPLAPFSLIEERTGGLLTPLNPEDKIYVERINNGVPNGWITNVGTFAEYIATNSPQQNTRKKVLEITQTGTSLTLDLSPYKTYSKFHIAFPSVRSAPHMNVTITGINDLLYGIESITMSGLDENTTYLPSSKTGDINFTLDSTDYEFPSKVYHFGGFNNGNELIFLHIDYAEAGASSSYKYVIENAIYGDAPLWTNTSLSDENIKIKGATGTTTLMLKHDGDVKFDVTPDFYGHDYNILFFVSIKSQDSSQATFKNSEMPLGIHALFKEVGIMIPTGVLLTDNEIIAIAKDNHTGSLSSTDTNMLNVLTYFKSPANILFNVTLLRDRFENINYYDPLPTHFGLYSVVVRGKYAQKQLNG